MQILRSGRGDPVTRTRFGFRLVSRGGRNLDHVAAPRIRSPQSRAIFVSAAFVAAAFQSAAYAALLLGLLFWTADGWSREVNGAWRPAASREAIVGDWLHQDYMAADLPDALEREKRQWKEAFLQSPESRGEPPVLARLKCFVSEDDSVVERRLLGRVLEELNETPERAALAREIDSLRTRQVPGRDARWKGLYQRACELRRAQRLSALPVDWNRFIYSQHPHVPHSWKYTEVLSAAHSDRQRHYRPGASLNLLRIDGIYGRVRTLVEDADGILRNPDVSFDGRRVLFAWKQSDRGDDFHLYELDLAEDRIRQLTDGAGVADYEGIYLPDGNLLFSSTRCCQTVDCNWVEVSNLYLSNGDGQLIRRVGFDQVHTIFPTLTDDGRVLFTRWEYNDRGQIYPQPLFQMNPDGTNQREFYGGNSWFPTNIIHARKIPDSRRVLAIVTGHHRPAHGKLAVIDPADGRQEGRGVHLLAPVREAEPRHVDRYALDGIQFQYPYPVGPEHCLVTAALPTAEGNLGRFNVYFMDYSGRRELLVEGVQAGEGVGCRQILPLAPRARPPQRPSRVDYARSTGVCYLQDVYQGAALAGIPRGEIKRLRVIALDYRAAAIGSLHQEGRGGTSEVTTPIAIGNGSWDVKVVLGTTPVYEDGSAMFQVPARTPVYFQALDQRGYVVQTMRSWTTLMPGETQACVGCHEHKNTVPRAAARLSLAMQAGAEPLSEFYGPPRGFSFTREIQPILDEHCVRCHQGAPGEPRPRLNLTDHPVLVGKTKRFFSRSYLTLTKAQADCGSWDDPLVNWIDSMSQPDLLPPYHRGAATSRLLQLLAAGHEGVRLTQEQSDKLACWIDLLVPFCGDYREAHGWSRDELEFYTREEQKRQRMESMEADSLRALSDLRGSGIGSRNAEP